MAINYFYTCANCGTENKKPKEIGWYKCKRCKQKQDGVNPRTETYDDDGNPIIDNIKTDEYQTPVMNDSAVDMDFKIEQKEMTFAKEQDVSSIIPKKEEVKPQQQIKPQNDNYGKKPFAPDMPRKMFEQIDAIMKKKTNEDLWDVSKEEEKKLGEVWADALNEMMPEASTKETKIALAMGLTIATYTPRVIDTIKAYKEARKRKEKENKESDKNG